MNRLKHYFSDIEEAANFLSLYFSTADYEGKACVKCPCKAVCRANGDTCCEDIIAEWLEGEAA